MKNLVVISILFSLISGCVIYGNDWSRDPIRGESIETIRADFGAPQEEYTDVVIYGCIVEVFPLIFGKSLVIELDEGFVQSYDVERKVGFTWQVEHAP